MSIVVLSADGARLFEQQAHGTAGPVEGLDCGYVDVMCSVRDGAEDLRKGCRKWGFIVKALCDISTAIAAVGAAAGCSIGGSLCANIRSLDRQIEELEASIIHERNEALLMVLGIVGPHMPPTPPLPWCSPVPWCP